MHSANSSGSVIAAASKFSPRQATPLWVIIVAITAQPGSGPNGNIRSTLAPAT